MKQKTIYAVRLKYMEFHDSDWRYEDYNYSEFSKAKEVAVRLTQACENIQNNISSEEDDELVNDILHEISTSGRNLEVVGLFEITETEMDI